MAVTALKGVREIVTYAKGKTSKTRAERTQAGNYLQSMTWVSIVTARPLTIQEIEELKNLKHKK